MSNLLIIMIVVYIATIIIQIGYCMAWYHNDPIFRGKLMITTVILYTVFAPIMVLFEIGAALLFIHLEK